MRHEELLNKIIKQELFELYQIHEAFDRPLNNIEKIDNYRYVVNDDGIEGVFTFRTLYNNRTIPNYFIHSDKVNIYYDVSWSWGSDMDNELKTAANWVRMTSTAFKIIDDFIRTMKPSVIKFSEQTPGNYKIYSNSKFTEKLSSLFSDHYHVKADVDPEDEHVMIYLFNKEVGRLLDDSIRKLTENCPGLKDPRKYRLYSKKKDYSGIVKNDMRKQQIRKILYTAKYL